MTFLVLLLGAIGLSLVGVGLPPVRRPTLTERIAPHLPGASLKLTATPTTFMQRVAANVPGRDDELAKRLASAGRDPDPLAFRAEQIAWGSLSLAGVAALSIVAAALGSDIDAATTPVLGVLSFLSGYHARDWWLGRQLRARRAALREELPTAIDLLALALIAGESPAAALERVGSTLRGSVGDEFGRILASVRSGAPLIDALQGAKDHTSDPVLARLLDSLTTALEKGSPLADVLRAQADEARQTRGREMLEAAGRKEVLMLIPVVFLILPVVVVYALFPGLVSLDLFVR